MTDVGPSKDDANQPAAPVVIDYEAPSEPTLTQRVSHGMMWMTLQQVSVKLLAIVQQIFVGILLSKSDLGLYNSATLMLCFLGWPQWLGLDTILIQRQRLFGIYENAANWMTFTAAAMLVIFVMSVSPIASTHMKTAPSPGLVAIVALTGATNIMAVVRTAKLVKNFEFRTVSFVNVGVSAITCLLTIILARSHCGPYSFAIPILIAGIYRNIALWIKCPTKLLSTPQFRRWWILLRDSRYFFVSGLCYSLITNADNLAIAIRHTQEELGIYQFAYMLCTQTGATFIFSFNATLFPAMSKIQNDPKRLLSVYLRSTRIIGAAGAVLCILQAALALPLLHLIFKDKWLEAVPVLQWLSVGVSLYMCTAPVGSLLQSQRQFKLFMAWYCMFSLSFVVAVSIGTYVGAALSMSIAVCIFYFISVPPSIYMAARSIGGTLSESLHAVFTPVSLAVISAIPFVLLERQLPLTRPMDVVSILIVSIGTLGVYAPLLRKFMPDEYHQLASRIVKVLNRFGLFRRTAV